LPVTLEIIRAELERVPVVEGVLVRVCREIVVGDPLLLDAHAGAAVDDPPIAVGRPPDRDVGPAVAVVVTRHRNVAFHSPLLDRLRSGGTAQDDPIAVRRTPDREVRPPVAVVVAGHRHVTRYAAPPYVCRPGRATHDPAIA